MIMPCRPSSRLDHHRAAIFQVEHGVGHGFALVVGDQHAVTAAGDLALVGQVVVEQRFMIAVPRVSVMSSP
jgi:hypothetical protein